MVRVTGSHLIGKALKLEGITNVFTLAGDHILPAMDVMVDMDFRFVDTRHEQAAVHMADGWSRTTGQLGVCMYTSPGFANAIPGLANALHSEAPLLSIAGSADLAELGRGAMQELDQVGMAAPITKGSFMVHDARRIPDQIARAVRLAFSGRRGPVHLTIPTDVQEQEVDEEDVVFYQPEEYRPPAAAAAQPELVRRAIDLLRQAKRPMVIAGDAASYGLPADSLRRFVETTRAPVLTEGISRGLISDEHPLCFGFFERGLNWVAKRLPDADLVLLLGRKQDSTIGFCRPPNVAADAKIIQVDPGAEEVGRNRGVAVGITGDVGAVLDQLADEAAAYSWEELPWVEELRGVQQAQDEWTAGLNKPEQPMHAMFVHKTIEPLLGPEDSIVYDGGDFCHFGRSFMQARLPYRWYYNPTLGMLGAALPTALAAKLARPDSRVIACVGDGAFGFNGMELDTAVRHNLDIVMVVGNDAAWGIDRQIQLGLYGRAIATDLLPTRYDLVAQGLGCYAELVENPEDLAPALQRALGAGRPAVLNVAVQRAISPRAQALIDRKKAGQP